MCFWLSYILWLLKSRSCISRNFVSYWRLKLFMILKTVIGWFTIKLIINFMTLFIPYEVIKVCMLWLLPKEVVGKSDLYSANKRILWRTTPVHSWHQINEMTKNCRKTWYPFWFYVYPSVSSISIPCNLRIIQLFDGVSAFVFVPLSTLSDWHKLWYFRYPI